MRATDLKKQKFGFALYDFSNSAYILIFNTYLFPLFFKESVLKNNPNTDFYWGLCIALSIGLALLISPLVGINADKYGRRYFLKISIFITFIGMLFLTFSPIDSVLLYSVIFIITNLFYTISLSLYDSMLSHVVKKEERIKLSGFAWGFGAAFAPVVIVSSTR